ncbi:hypothetical protein [Rhodococcus artemisiae]|uniref:Uncharacterized protein n=1 Tax=Rhodococcus artemisiae TaxID=714159 RepID=A0ABU7LL90_9NOCA|nr:hypothetical protein [Rhodococcus artemisiae]MEE2062342.1 hypothetical protein [Rhodococcus artemisiae]
MTPMISRWFSSSFDRRPPTDRTDPRPDRPARRCAALQPYPMWLAADSPGIAARTLTVEKAGASIPAANVNNQRR